MTKFDVHIETENAAFFPDWEPEVCRILRRLADELERGTFTSGDLKLRDVNGNTTGRVWYDSLVHHEEGGAR